MGILGAVVLLFHLPFTERSVLFETWLLSSSSSFGGVRCGRSPRRRKEANRPPTGRGLPLGAPKVVPARYSTLPNSGAFPFCSKVGDPRQTPGGGPRQDTHSKSCSLGGVRSSVWQAARQEAVRAKQPAPHPVFTPSPGRQNKRRGGGNAPARPRAPPGCAVNPGFPVRKRALHWRGHLLVRAQAGSGVRFCALQCIPDPPQVASWPENNRVKNAQKRDFVDSKSTPFAHLCCSGPRKCPFLLHEGW
jgi:hypothetical protein